MKIKLTNDGKAMLLSFAQGNKIKFTKVVFGNGNYHFAQGDKENPRIINAIKNAAFDAAPTVESGQSVAKLTATLNNTGLESGFHVTEIGYYAKLITVAEDNTETESEEKLYALGNADESEADYVPAASERAVTVTYDGLIYIGDADVSAVLGENAQYVSKSDFEKHINNKNNPHATTKGQVGLGNVPNVATNDQTPTYESTDKLTKLESGEKLSAAFPKIQKAVADLITHIGTKKGNPHNVSIDEVGGAAKKHTHDASEINNGILPVARGGTGLSKGVDFTMRENVSNKNYGRCYGHIVLPGGLLIQWGRVNVDGHSHEVWFAKEFANTNYALSFPTCGNDFIPVWRNPDKRTTGFTMTRTGGVDSSKLINLLKSIFVFQKDKIDDLFGASQTADWIAIGQAKEA